MSDNDWKSRLGVVFSTNPDYNYDKEDEDVQAAVGASSQDLRVWLESRKGGKKTSVIKGFRGPESALKELATLLKSRCGVGGAAKDGEILIQGDHRDKIVDILRAEGYKVKKAGG